MKINIGKFYSQLSEPCLSRTNLYPSPILNWRSSGTGGGESIRGERLLAFIAFQSGIVEGLEVTATLSALMDWVGFDVLPQFDRFFVK